MKSRGTFVAQTTAARNVSIGLLCPSRQAAAISNPNVSPRIRIEQGWHVKTFSLLFVIYFHAPKSGGLRVLCFFAFSVQGSGIMRLERQNNTRAKALQAMRTRLKRGAKSTGLRAVRTFARR